MAIILLTMYWWNYSNGQYQWPVVLLLLKKEAIMYSNWQCQWRTNVKVLIVSVKWPK